MRSVLTAGVRHCITATLSVFLIACGGEETKTVTVTDTTTITEHNNTPRAVVTGPTRVNEETNIVLDGSTSFDLDGTVISWQWSQVDNGAATAMITGELSDTATVTTPDISIAENIEIQLTVVDDKGASDTVFHTITVLPVFAYNACTADDVTGIAASGTFTISKAEHLLALCDGEVLVANAALSRIDRMHLASGTVTDYYQLTAAPGQMAFDTQRGIVYAAMTGASHIARLNLNTDSVDYIDIAGIASGIAVRETNGIYVALDRAVDQLYWYDANDLEHGPWPIQGTLITYNNSSAEIIAAPLGSSPIRPVRYGFDVAGDLEQRETLDDAGGNGKQIRISPDNNHLVIIAGGGNGASYSVFDFNPAMLTSTYGEFDTGAYPTGADFSANSGIFATSNGKSVMAFRVADHTEIVRHQLPLCNYGSIKGTYVSRGGNLLMALQACEFGGTTTKLHFYKLPR
jgi:hypothetical protein